MSLENTKTLLGVDNARVAVIYDTYEERLLRRLQRTDGDVESIPRELEYIVTECTIARYNRIGSEGLSSESMDGHSASYVDTDISDYEDEIREFLQDEDDVSRRRGRVRFI